MTAISGGSALTQQLYAGLFERLNTDADDAVSFAEISAVSGVSAGDAEAMFKTLDADGDGRVIRSEMKPTDRFSTDMVNAMLAVQTDVTPENDRKILSDLFMRADLDGDGALSATEMDAERTLRRSTSLDAGYNPDHIFLAKDADGDGQLRPDEIAVGHMVHLPLSAIRFADDLIRPVRVATTPDAEGGQTAPTQPRTPEDRQKLLDQFAADHAERTSGPAGAYRYLSRELGDLRGRAGADLASAPITDALAARLMQRILQGWSAAPTSIETSA